MNALPRTATGSGAVIAAAAALAGVLALLPRDLGAFSTTGSSLGLTQRDVRVYDNFTDAAAHANLTIDPAFPGFVGVELAVWKGIVEWGSRAHGDGSGDPSQTMLGDGGANFDASWQGEATAVGGTNDNVVSELSGGQGGVLAFAELPSSDGWRIRFYADWTWNDGPGSLPAGHMDVQGILVHEYGHALGLGHSSASVATMRGTAIGNGVEDRSIEADDIAGVQAIYGAAAATKPRIESIEKCGSSLVLHGANFSASGNEVWFTQASPGGTGTPIKVTSVASTAGGTELAVVIPGGAGSGDVLVKTSGNTHASLSNAWPLDAANDVNCGPFVPPPEEYCFGDGGATPGCTPCPCGNDAPLGSGGGCANSVGTWAFLLSSGAASVSSDTLRFDVFGGSPSSFAVLVSADNRLPTAGTCPLGSGLASPVLDGLRCVGGALRRHGARALDSLGANSTPWGPPGAPATGIAAQGGFAAGQVRCFQVFYRDLATAACGSGQNTSNAVAVTFH